MTLSEYNRLLYQQKHPGASVRYVWTPSETERALALKASGLTYPDIAAHLSGRTPKAVKRRLQRLAA